MDLKTGSPRMRRVSYWPYFGGGGRIILVKLQTQVNPRLTYKVCCNDPERSRVIQLVVR